MNEGNVDLFENSKMSIYLRWNNWKRYLDAKKITLKLSANFAYFKDFILIQNTVYI